MLSCRVLINSVIALLVGSFARFQFYGDDKTKILVLTESKQFTLIGIVACLDSSLSKCDGRTRT